MKPLGRVLLLALCLGAGVAHADLLVCKQGQVVRPGMRAEEVLEKCGKPTSAVARTEDVRRRNVEGKGGMIKIGELYTEIWRYDRGTQKPAAIVTVTEGEVVSIVYEE